MNTKKFSLVPQAAVFAAGIAAALVLRTLQYFTVIEEYTGFYKNFDAKTVVFYIVIGAASLFFIVTSLFSKGTGFDHETAKRPVTAIISVLCGAAAFASVYGDYSAIGVDTSAYTVSSPMSGSSSNVLTYAVCIFGLISAVYFIVLGVAYFTGRRTEPYKVLALVPVLWNIARLVLRFTRTISYMRVSELLLEMLAICCYCLFFMAYARCTSAVNEEGSVKRIRAFGLTGALMGLLCFVPRVIAVCAGRPELIYVLSRVDFSDLALALFMLVTVFTRLVPGADIVNEKGEAVREI